MDNSDDNALVAQILSSYLSNNTVPDLSSVIESVKRAFNEGTVSAPLLQRKLTRRSGSRQFW